MKQMIGGHAAIMTWQGKTIDETAGDKLQSFSHDYRQRFAEAGLRVLLDFDCVADLDDARRRRNKLYYVCVNR